MAVYYINVRIATSPARSLGPPWRDGVGRERCLSSSVVLHTERATNHVGDLLVSALQLRDMKALRERWRKAVSDYAARH